MILFMPAGHLGLCSSHGSVTMRFPPGVVIMNVECPYHVIASFCIAMERLCYHCGDFDNPGGALGRQPLTKIQQEYGRQGVNFVFLKTKTAPFLPSSCLLVL